jgi:hypothetical protein
VPKKWVFREKILSNFIRSIGPMEATVMVIFRFVIYSIFVESVFDGKQFFRNYISVDLEKIYIIGWDLRHAVHIADNYLVELYIFQRRGGRIRNGTAVALKSNWIARFAQNHFLYKFFTVFIFVKPLTGFRKKKLGSLTLKAKP